VKTVGIFLLGKFFGLVMDLTLNTSAMATGLYMALWNRQAMPAL